MQCGTMSCQDAGVVLGMVLPFVLACLLAVVGGMKVIDTLDRNRRR